MEGDRRREREREGGSRVGGPEGGTEGPGEGRVRSQQGQHVGDPGAWSGQPSAPQGPQPQQAQQLLPQHLPQVPEQDQIAFQMGGSTEGSRARVMG